MKLLLLFVSLSAFAGHQHQDLEKFLLEFDQNPTRVMNQLPAKSKTGAHYIFSGLNSSDIIDAKSTARNKHCAGGECQKSSFNYNDDPMYLLDPVDEVCDDRFCRDNFDYVTDIFIMDRFGFKRSKLEFQPWSDDYWPLAAGATAKRYVINPTPDGDIDWKFFHQDYLDNPTTEMVDRGLINKLSPAEKYDLLVGDENFTMTKMMWNEGRSYYNNSGKVERWMGICHGWAAAAFMHERPAKAITVKTYNNKNVTFYPSDIKALTSLLWAKNDYQSRFIGGRCNTKGPERDPETGRVNDPNCRDNNPATWHIAVVNQIAVARRSFVMDATFDYEVWNQPVLEYRYRYFNPKTKRATDDLSKAIVNLDQFKNDKFKKYRAHNAKKVVGVEMVVEYLSEGEPVQENYNRAADDFTTEVVYRYDLELDSTDQLVGGEWYTNSHPDFLWVPVRGTKARSEVDRSMERMGEPKFSGNSVPKSYRHHARRASRRGAPLLEVVEGLINKSKN